MWGLLAGFLGVLSLGCALAVFVLFCRADFVVGLLAWGWLPSRWDEAEPLDDHDVELLRRVVARLRLPALVALAAISFVAGAVVTWVRLSPGG